MSREYYTVNEVAKNLKVTPLTIKRYIADNKIISFKIGGVRRINKNDLDSFIEAQKNQEIYNSLEKDIKVIINNDFKKLVNFSENLKLPTHRWFNIKEGYSEELVTKVIKRYKVKEGYVIDPFLGSGTTAMGATKNGLDFIGFEVNPFLAFLGSVKITARKDEIDNEYLEKILSIKSKKNITRPKLSIIEKLFRENLDSILTIKAFIKNIPDGPNRRFYELVFLCALEPSSYAKKDGNGLKYPPNKKVKIFKEAFREKFNEMLNDSSKNSHNVKNSLLYNIDSRNICSLLKNKTKVNAKDLLNRKPTTELKKLAGTCKLAIFSPPYMNCFDYTEVYKTELWLGGFVESYEDMKLIRTDSLSSHLNKKYVEDTNFYNSYVAHFTSLLKKKKLWDKRINLMVTEYFHDMRDVMMGIYELLEDGAKCIIVVGNSAYGSIAIPTDLILGKIGKEMGFHNVQIEVARSLGTSSQQYKTINNIELLRESLVILEK